MSNGNACGQSAIRRNIYSLDPQGPEIAAIARGVAAMMARPSADPTSWIYQANIHGTYDPEDLRGWHTCQHGSFFFLSWHRMYLYWFERILRAASGDPTLALPYWDYGNPEQRALPEALRSPADPSNPLYVRQRRSSVNAGEPLPASDVISEGAFRQTRFAAPRGELSFGGWIVPAPQHRGRGFGQLELQPHNTVHTSIGGIGGWMSDVNMAARDFVFWLHHANIDRMWKRWLDLGGGRGFPARTGEEAVWWEIPFLFFDEQGRPVEMTGADIVDTVGQLGYCYDDDPAPEPEGEGAEEAREMGEHMEEIRLTSGDAITLGAVPVRAPVRVPGAGALHAMRFAEDGAEAKADTEAEAEREQIKLTLHQIAFEQIPGMTYEVYLNLPEGQEPEPGSRYYLGNLGFFALTPPVDISFDATENVAALRESGEFTGAPTVTFVPTLRPARAEPGESAPAEEPVVPVRIGEVTLEAEQGEG